MACLENVLYRSAPNDEQLAAQDNDEALVYVQMSNDDGPTSLQILFEFRRHDRFAFCA